MASARPPRESTVDRSWEEPEPSIGSASTTALPPAPESLAAGSVTVPAWEQTPKFFDMPVGPPPERVRSASRPTNDATSIVKPLPRPDTPVPEAPRPSAVLPVTLPRRSWWYRLATPRGRWAIALIAGAVSGVVLACIVMALSSSETVASKVPAAEPAKPAAQKAPARVATKAPVATKAAVTKKVPPRVATKAPVVAKPAAAKKAPARVATKTPAKVAAKAPAKVATKAPAKVAPKAPAKVARSAAPKAPAKATAKAKPTR